MESRGGRIVNAAMFFLFLWAALLQYNDPDPILWAVTYGLAAVFSLAAVLGRPTRILPALLAAVALLWSGSLALRVLGKQSLVESEEGREMLGLLLVFLWMTTLALGTRSRPRERASAGTNAD